MNFRATKKVLDKLTDGQSIKSIAKEEKVTEYQVRKLAREFSIDTYKIRKQKILSMVLDCLLNEGMSIKETSEKINKSTSTVNRYIEFLKEYYEIDIMKIRLKRRMEIIDKLKLIENYGWSLEQRADFCQCSIGEVIRYEKYV